MLNPLMFLESLCGAKDLTNEWVKISHLKDEAYGCPWQCRMLRIILNCGVTNLLEKIDPSNNFAKEVSQDDDLASIWSVKAPPFLDTVISGGFRQGLQICQYVNF